MRSFRSVFVGVLIGMALASLAFLWRRDGQYIKQQSKMNYDDGKGHPVVCVCVCGGGGGVGWEIILLYRLYRYVPLRFGLRVKIGTI